MFLGSTYRIDIKSEFGLAGQIDWTLQIAWGTNLKLEFDISEFGLARQIAEKQSKKNTTGYLNKKQDSLPSI